MASGSEAASSYGATENLEGGASSEKRTTAIGNSTSLTACLIVADVVGAGILGLPVAVAKIGWLPGLLLILLLLAMNVHISILMWRIRMHFPEINSFMQMADMAFSKAPEGQRERIAYSGGLCQHVFIFAMLGCYILTAGKAIGHVFYDTFLCLPTWCVLAVAVILPFHATARRLGTWKNLVWLNIVTITGACLLPLIYLWYQGPDKSRPPGSEVMAVAPFTVPNAFAAMSTFTFGFTGQFMIIEIISEMSDPSEFPKAYVYMSAPFQALAFVLVGVGGYLLIGSKATGMIGDNLPFGMVFRITFLCLVVQMTVTYLIKGIVLCRGIHNYMVEDVDKDDSSQAWSTWASLALGTGITAWTISSIVPFFNDLVDLIGTSVTPICCYIIPIVCYLRFVKDFKKEEDELSMVEKVVIGLELILAGTLLTFGTYFALRHIIDHWATYGPPFGCHCEGMWNNCVCSAHRVGMIDRCQVITMEIASQVQAMVDMNFAWVVDHFLF